MLAAGVTVLLFVLLGTGIPVAFAMLVSGVTGLYLIGGDVFVFSFLRSTALSVVNSYELLAVPMFILMGEILVVSRIADDLFDAIQSWVAARRGGLAIATALTGALFGAISGSSTAAAATLSSTSLPAMQRHGYDQQLASGVVAISGTLAMLIPPSVALIVYAILADESVAKLLMAGIIPGILVTLTVMLTVKILVMRNPELAPLGKRSSLVEKLHASKGVWAFVALFIAMTGSMYAGIATPTEAAGLGAFGAVVLALVRRSLGWGELVRALSGAARTTTMIYFIIIGAHVFGYFLTLSQATQDVIEMIRVTEPSLLVMMTAIVIMYLILGCFMDQLAIMILTVPIMLPIIKSLGYDPIWFGVVIVLLAEIGMVTPPVGLNVFVVSRVTGLPVSEVFRGIWPHVLSHLALVILLILFPAIILWLPSTM